LTEQDLIKGCIEEKRHVQQLLFERYAPRLLTVALRYAHHRAEAEDLLQDAFVKIFNNIHRFENKGSFEGWMRRIVVNTALKNYQRLRFQREDIGLEHAPDQNVAPTAIATMSEAELLALIAKLPDGYRIVFNMAAIEGFSHAEIAAHLGIEESTSRSQLTKARAMLQRFLKEIETAENQRIEQNLKNDNHFSNPKKMIRNLAMFFFI
jgi:RNA polymerase sigma factor (sigma-70 family)